MVNLLILLANLAFAYIWGVWGWGDSELYESGWWFDNYGHILFGFGWGFIIIYWIRKYAPATYIVANKFFLALVAIAVVTLLEVIIWEGLELLWDLKLQPDFANWLAKAQKGSADTTIDIIMTALGAIVAMLFWGGYRKFYEWKWPNDAQKEAIEEAREKAKIYALEITQMGREHRKQIMQEFRRSLKKKLKDIKTP